MSQPHIIRLRGPWKYKPLERFVPGADGQCRAATDNLPPAGKTPVPADWAATLGADFRGRVRYTRTFHRPTNLEPAERVWLALDGVDHRAEVELNGVRLGEVMGRDAARRFDVTALLESQNRLVVDVSLMPEVFDDALARADRAGLAGGLTGEVRLEIGSEGAGR